MIIDNVRSLSIQRYAYRIIEKIIQICKGEHRAKLLKSLFQDSKLSYIIKYKFGLSVVSKAIDSMTIEEKVEIKELLLKRMTSLSKQEQLRLNAIINSI